MKTLRTAAFVVGAVALVATGVGALGTAGLLGSAIASGGAIAGIATAATLTTVGTIAGAVAALATLAAGAPKGSVGGSATQFKIDKDAGLPVALGRTYSGGNVVHRQYYGSKNSLESWVTVHSIGPVRSLGPLLINKVAVALAGTAITGSYANWMWLDQQLGACPEPQAMAGPQGNFPGWGPAHKLSGLAADLWTLKFDEKMKVYPNGVPQRGRIVEGVYVYDPRLDSTYPGGSGACRLGQEATYVWSDNPALHAITWAFGRYQNGVLIAGGGLDADGIDMAPLVDWANVCEANSWIVGGVVYTSSDNSWDILKMIAQAGGGEVFPVGAQLSCSFNAPRVSIGTITSNDIMGDVDVPGTASRRARRNTVIPRVRLESHGWEEVPLEAIAIPEYVAFDGGSRPTEITFPLVQQVDQGAQLGLYALWNGRELDGIVLPSKVYAIGYRPGDCLTVDIPEAALARDVVVRQREIEGSTMAVTLTCRSETFAKHAFCLGKTGNAPPTPDLSVPISYPVEVARGAHVLIRQSLPYPVTSDADSVLVAAFDGVIDDGSQISFPAADLAGKTAGTAYVLYWRLSASAYVVVLDPGLAEAADSDLVFLGNITTANADGTYPETPTPPGGWGGNGSGGNCLDEASEYLLANGDRSGPGAAIAGADLAPGAWLWTQHADTREWMAAQVTHVSRHLEPVFAADGCPRATRRHRFADGAGWLHAGDIGRPDGTAWVLRITVAEAQSYMARAAGGDWVLSHNLKPVGPDQ